jgi:hypothetical protein
MQQVRWCDPCALPCNSAGVRGGQQPADQGRHRLCRTAAVQHELPAVPGEKFVACSPSNHACWTYHCCCLCSIHLAPEHTPAPPMSRLLIPHPSPSTPGDRAPTPQTCGWPRTRPSRPTWPAAAWCRPSPSPRAPAAWPATSECGGQLHAAAARARRCSCRATGQAAPAPACLVRAAHVRAGPWGLDCRLYCPLLPQVPEQYIHTAGGLLLHGPG